MNSWRVVAAMERNGLKSSKNTEYGLEKVDEDGVR